jgi:hypothetical protein
MSLGRSYNLEHHFIGIIYDCIMLIELSFTIVIVFILQATVATIVNYNNKMFIVQATDDDSWHNDTRHNCDNKHNDTCNKALSIIVKRRHSV